MHMIAIYGHHLWGQTCTLIKKILNDQCVKLLASSATVYLDVRACLGTIYHTASRHGTRLAGDAGFANTIQEQTRHLLERADAFIVVPHTR